MVIKMPEYFFHANGKTKQNKFKTCIACGTSFIDEQNKNRCPLCGYIFEKVKGVGNAKKEEKEQYTGNGFYRR